jgi:hypothetical protein
MDDDMNVNRPVPSVHPFVSALFIGAFVLLMAVLWLGYLFGAALGLLIQLPLLLGYVVYATLHKLKGTPS